MKRGWTGMPKTVGQPIIIDCFLIICKYNVRYLSDNRGIVLSLQLVFCPPMID